MCSNAFVYSAIVVYVHTYSCQFTCGARVGCHAYNVHIDGYDTTMYYIILQDQILEGDSEQEAKLHEVLYGALVPRWGPKAFLNWDSAEMFTVQGQVFACQQCIVLSKFTTSFYPLKILSQPELYTQ